MKKLSSLFLLLIVLAVSGCAAQSDWCATISSVGSSHCENLPTEEEAQRAAEKHRKEQAAFEEELYREVLRKKHATPRKPRIATELAYKKGEYQNAATIIFKGPVTPPPYGSSSTGLKEEDIVSCLEKNIKKHNPDQSFISYNQFANTMFPDLPDFDVPSGPESFPRSLADEKFHKDVLSWGVRYLIFVGGATESISHGAIIPSNPPLGALGVVYWDNKTQLAASVLDLHQKKTIADGIEVISEDISWLAIALLVPAGFPSFTKSDSCEDMGNRLGKILLERAKQ